MGVATLGRSSWVRSGSRLGWLWKVRQQAMLSSSLCFKFLPRLPQIMSTTCNPNISFLLNVAFGQSSITATGRHARANLPTAATTPSGSHLPVCKITQTWVAVEARRRCQVPWTWSCLTWVLEIEHGSSASAFNHQAISLVATFSFLMVSNFAYYIVLNRCQLSLLLNYNSALFQTGELSLGQSYSIYLSSHLRFTTLGWQSLL